MGEKKIIKTATTTTTTSTRNKIIRTLSPLAYN